MVLFVMMMACAPAVQLVVVEPGHYVEVRGAGDALYDCYSRPPELGGDWKPTCIQFGSTEVVPDWIRYRWTHTDAHEVGRSAPGQEPPPQAPPKKDP